MIAFLSTPLFEMMNVMNAEDALLWSYITITLIPCPFWLIAGYQDLKRHEISNGICLLIMAVTGVHALLFNGTGVASVVGFLAYLTFREKEVSLVGQADFMMLAHWMTASFVYNTGSGVMLVSSIVFLLCIVVYILVYRTPDGKKWHRGMMMPIIPPYSASVLLMTFYQYPLSRILFYMGW